MNLALAVVEEAADFSTKAEYIKDAVKVADLKDVVEVYMFVAIEEEETICAVDKMLEWCNLVTDHNGGSPVI